MIVHGQRFRAILGVLPPRLTGEAEERLEWTIYDNHSGSSAHPELLMLDELRDVVRGCGFPIHTLIHADAQPRRLEIRAQEPGRRWWGEGMVLLGDAAHASSPELGQGACQSFESTLALAETLDGAPSLAAALADYEARRRVRAELVRSAAELTTVLAGLAGPVDAIRDLLLAPGWSVAGRSLLRAIASG